LWIIAPVLHTCLIEILSTTSRQHFVVETGKIPLAVICYKSHGLPEFFVNQFCHWSICIWNSGLWKWDWKTRTHSYLTHVGQGLLPLQHKINRPEVVLTESLLFFLFRNIENHIQNRMIPVKKIVSNCIYVLVELRHDWLKFMDGCVAFATFLVL
jgi:hypothetical protein